MNECHFHQDDPIIAEIRKFREEFSIQFHGDIHAMAEEMRRVAEASGQPGITRPPKRYPPAADTRISIPESQTPNPM